jgi:hypothetical protein
MWGEVSPPQAVKRGFRRENRGVNTQEIISNEQVSSLERIAAIIAKSGMGGFKTPEQATVAMLLALAEGIPLGRVIHEYHVINGRLSLRSECMLARFQKAGGTIQYIDRGPACGTVSATHPKGGSLTVSWTMARAREAGLTSNPTWTKHPTAMLSARATAEAVRAVYPACLSGIITEEEAVEITALPALNGNGSHPLPAAVAPEPIAALGDVYVNDRAAGPLERPSGAPSPGGLTPATRAYTIIDGQRYAAPTRRRKGERSPAFNVPQQDPAILTQEPAPAAPEPAPEATAPQPEALEPAEPETHKPGSNVASFWHPLDDALGGLNQEKLSAFQVNHGLIDAGQNYKYCGPKATSRILKQLPSFLKAAGFDEVLPS